MNILAVDTSGPACSAALFTDGTLFQEVFMNAHRTHSETLMPALDELMMRADMKMSDIDLFCAVAGPGSFTGVRIGVCCVKALAHATGKPCVRVNALEALAKLSPPTGCVVCPILDARREQVYCAAFRNGERILDDAALPLMEFIDMLPTDEKLYFTGDGVAVYEKKLVERLGDRAIIAGPCSRVLRASAACEIAMSDDCPRMSATELTPIYLRAPQAVREREDRLTRAKA